MNYFSPRSAAERYAKGRPYFHPNTIQHIKDWLGLEHKLEKALDIACGTGLSTKALTAIATKVAGTDISPEMLKLAEQDDKISYSIAPAEQQPFPAEEFDLVTVGSGIHWFAIDRFLAEVNRILKSRGLLVLYENHFIADMPGQEAFTHWFPEVYLKKYPSPARHNDYPWNSEHLAPKNFNFMGEEKFKNAFSFTKKQLALYFTTQSNIIAAVESKQTTYEEAERWLLNELHSFFDTDETTRVINYGNWIKYMQKRS